MSDPECRLPAVAVPQTEPDAHDEEQTPRATSSFEPYIAPTIEPQDPEQEESFVEPSTATKRKRESGSGSDTSSKSRVRLDSSSIIGSSFYADGESNYYLSSADNNKRSPADDDAQVVALKISKASRCHVKHEIEMLELIRKWDPHNSHVFNLPISSFMHNDRSGIIFPLLGMTFLDFIENDEFYPLSVENMEEITLKALDAVSFLHSNDMTHLNFKIDNMCFRSNDWRPTLDPDGAGIDIKKGKISFDIALIDFGNAVHRIDKVGARFKIHKAYRPVELLLLMEMEDQSLDNYRISLTLLELASKQPIFSKAMTTPEHIAAAIQLCRPLNGDFHESAKESPGKDFYTNALDKDNGAVMEVYNIKPLKTLLTEAKCHNQRLEYILRGLVTQSPKQQLKSADVLGILKAAKDNK